MGRGGVGWLLLLLLHLFGFCFVGFFVCVCAFLFFRHSTSLTARLLSFCHPSYAVPIQPSSTMCTRLSPIFTLIVFLLSVLGFLGNSKLSKQYLNQRYYYFQSVRELHSLLTNNNLLSCVFVTHLSCTTS